MSAPKRIPRKRTQGWRMPENTVYVGRGSRWGNPWRVEDGMSPNGAVWRYRDAVNGLLPFTTVPSAGEIRSLLDGKDLACWCPLDQPCHADVLLEIANGGRS
ncbi:hypothetical protein CRM73_00255 [Kocuria sp. CCUG 69068]|uniref:DUF4326 domain-containing protein n=1 Tax=Kocuria sp. CCUG 69068 TaxID=2043138 RepID=UPI001E645CDF|nr:hypothetical protein [Kocuria sp. CCUG 69068]